MIPKIIEQNSILEWSSEQDYPVASLVKPLGGGGPLYYSKLASGPSTSAGPKDPTLSSNIEYWSVFSATGSIPVGTIIWYSTATAPIGYLVCNGQAVSRTVYSDLFEVIGTTYGAGDGSTTFNLPNLLDKFIEGANSNVGTSVDAGLPNIEGQLTTRPNSINGADGGVFSAKYGAFSSSAMGVAGNTNKVTVVSSAIAGDRINFSASNSNSIYGNSSTVQPPAVKLLPCIKAYSDVDNLGSCDVAQLENYVQNNVVHLTGDEVVNGFKTFTEDVQLTSTALYTGARYINIDNVDITRGTAVPTTAYHGIHVRDKDQNSISEMLFNYNASNESYVTLSAGNGSVYTSAKIGLWCKSAGPSFQPESNGTTSNGLSSRKWKEIWCTQSSINSSSDERIKSEIEPISDTVLDAWNDVQYTQFHFKDAVDEKGTDKARLHTGLIAQRVAEKLLSKNVNPEKYGFYLYDSWEATPEEKDEKGNIIQEASPAGDSYGLRYTEALCMEAAYQRRENRRLKEKVASLEERLASLEEKLK